MSKLGGYDFVVVLAENVVYDLIRSRLMVAGVSLNGPGPFSVEIRPSHEVEVSLLVRDILLELIPSDRARIVLPFHRSAMSMDGEEWCGLQGSMVIELTWEVEARGRDAVVRAEPVNLDIQLTGDPNGRLKSLLTQTGTIDAILHNLGLEIPALPLEMGLRPGQDGYFFPAVVAEHANVAVQKYKAGSALIVAGVVFAHKRALARTGEIDPQESLLTNMQGVLLHLSPDVIRRELICPAVAREAARDTIQQQILNFLNQWLTNTQVSEAEFNGLVAAFPDISDQIVSLAGSDNQQGFERWQWDSLVAELIARVVSRLPGDCGLADSIETVDLKLTHIDFRMLYEAIEVKIRAEKSGPCYEAFAWALSQVRIARNVATGEIEVVQMPPLSDVDVNLKWHCIIAVGFVMGLVFPPLLALLAATFRNLEPFTILILRKFLDSEDREGDTEALPGLPLLDLRLNELDVMLRPDALSVRGTAHVHWLNNGLWLGDWADHVGFQLETRLSSSDPVVVSEGVWSTIVCARNWEKEKEYPWTLTKQSQEVRIRFVGVTGVAGRVRPKFSIVAGGDWTGNGFTPQNPPVELDETGDSLIVSQVLVSRPDPVETGGIQEIRDVRLGYEIADDELRLVFEHQPGNFGFDVVVGAIDCSGKTITLASSLPASDRVVVSYSGWNLAIGKNYYEDQIACMRQAARAVIEQKRTTSPIWDSILELEDWIGPERYPADMGREALNRLRAFRELAHAELPSDTAMYVRLHERNLSHARAGQRMPAESFEQVFLQELQRLHAGKRQ